MVALRLRNSTKEQCHRLVALQIVLSGFGPCKLFLAYRIVPSLLTSSYHAYSIPLEQVCPWLEVSFRFRSGYQRSIRTKLSDRDLSSPLSELRQFTRINGEYVS